MIKHVKRVMFAALALAGLALAPEPSAAMPMVDLSPAVAAHAAPLVQPEQARIVCGPYGCFHRGGFHYGYYHRPYGFYHHPYYGPRFYHPYYHRHYGFYRPYRHFHHHFYY